MIARMMLAFVWLIPIAAWAQGPITVTVTPTLNPLPIGLCGAVQLSVVDPATRDMPRNALGARVTIADFDMTVAGASVVGYQIDASHFAACACQGGTAGSTATVTATYPARSLAQRAQVAGVPRQTQATFTIATAKGGVNPPGCANPTAALPRIAPPAIPAATIASPVSGASSNPVGGVRDPSVRPVDPVAGIPDDSIRPVAPVAGVRDPSIKPAPVAGAGGVARGGASPGVPVTPAPPVATPVVRDDVSRASATPLPGGLPGTTRAPLAPGKSNPSGLTAVQTGPSQVTLSWQPVDGVYRLWHHRPRRGAGHGASVRRGHSDDDDRDECAGGKSGMVRRESLSSPESTRHARTSDRVLSRC